MNDFNTMQRMFATNAANVMKASTNPQQQQQGNVLTENQNNPNANDTCGCGTSFSA